MATATYNWTIKPNITNKWNITVPSTADDVKPTGFAYIAHFGNDTTGNGSRKYPFKTFTKASRSGIGGTIIAASGVYRDVYTVTGGAGAYTLVGDGNVIMDVTLLGNATFTNGQINCNHINVTFRGGTAIGNTLGNLYDVTGVAMGSSGNFISPSRIQDSVFTNATFAQVQSMPNPGDWKNITFYRCNLSFQSCGFQSVAHCLFVECNISCITQPSHIDYCQFWNCNFRFNGTYTAATATYYPSVPTGYTYINTLAGIQSSSVTGFGAAPYNFNNCLVADPLFNNVAINDFTLAPTSPAKNRSYFGYYVGAYSIATVIKVDTNALTSGFDNSSAVNLTIATNSLTLTDVTQPAQITAKPVANKQGRDIARIPVLAFNGDRNGEVIDTSSDLATTTISAGTAVGAATPYLVEIGSITYNGAVYSAGQRFTSTAAGGDTFTTSTGGVIREILEAPSRQAIEGRFSDGAAGTIDNTGTINTDSWYYVESGSATYSGNSYAAGSFFKGLAGTGSFSGTGIVREALTSSDVYYTFEINQKPTTNNTGNVRTGSIIRGNGDKDFDRTVANVFPINKKFIQLRYSIQVNNLIP